MLPLLAPSILAGVAGTRALILGATASELFDYFALLGLFGFIFTAGGLGLFDAVVEG
jgi:heme exporter protein B